MKPRDVRDFVRKCDRIAIGELLCIDGQLMHLYTQRFVERRTLQEIADDWDVSYSYISKLSSDLNSVLEALPL